MKIAVSGKGGSGKTSVVSCLARIFEKNGFKVIAVDADPSMNLNLALGMKRPPPIAELKDLIEERTYLQGGLYRLNPKVDDIPDRYSTKKGNIMLIVMGTVKNAGSGCVCPENTFLRALLRHLTLKRGEVLILDTEAGLEHFGRGLAKNFNLMVIVVEPSYKSIETANRIYELSKQLEIKNIVGIGNKIMFDEQVDFIKNNINFEVLEYIPYDDEVVKSEFNLGVIPENSIFFKKIENFYKKIIKIVR